jgi:chromosome segregation ATPase
MICSSSEIAQKIAYNHNRQLSCKCVTYEGDVYEQGTLSGGYMNLSNLILPQFA